jgi:hypothetical protein
MGKTYFTYRGWKGLSDKGKLHALLIFLGSTFILFFVFKFIFEKSLNFDFSLSNNFGTYFFAIGGSLLITSIAIKYLDRNIYSRPEPVDYFCADCGQYLGTRPTVCKRCGSNRYSTKDTGVGKTIRNR